MNANYKKAIKIYKEKLISINIVKAVRHGVVIIFSPFMNDSTGIQALFIQEQEHSKY